MFTISHENTRYFTIFTISNGIAKTPRDNSPEFIYKALWFHRALFFAYRRIISLELRLTKVRPLPFGLKTTLSCFCDFAAVLTVHSKIKTLCLWHSSKPTFRGGFLFLSLRTEERQNGKHFVFSPKNSYQLFS